MVTIRRAAAFALVLPFAGSAYAADDVAYCQALAAKYETHIVRMMSGHYRDPGTADGAVAVSQCSRGNTAGIPVLERKLRDAKIELPPRG